MLYISQLKLKENTEKSICRRKIHTLSVQSLHHSVKALSLIQPSKRTLGVFLVRTQTKSGSNRVLIKEGTLRERWGHLRTGRFA